MSQATSLLRSLPLTYWETQAVWLLLDEAASPRVGGSGLGGCADWEEVEPPMVLV